MRGKTPASIRLVEDYLQQNIFSDSFFSESKINFHGWGPVQTYPAGTEITRQDSPANAVYLIKRGLVKLTRIEKDGSEVIAGLRRRNWLIGAPSALLNKTHTFTTTAVTNCLLRCISAELFLQIVLTNAEFSQKLLRILSKEIFSHGLKIVSLGSMPARGRLNGFLYEMIRELEQSTDIKKTVELQKPLKLYVPLKYKEIAQLIAVTPEHFSRLLKKMEEEGIIRRNKGYLIVENPERLLQEIS